MNTRMIRNGKVAEFGDVFRPRIKQLDASEWVEVGEVVE